MTTQAKTWILGPAVIRGMVASIQEEAESETNLLIAHVDNVDGFGLCVEGQSKRNATILSASLELLSASRIAFALLSRIETDTRLNGAHDQEFADVIAALHSAIGKAEA